jgi:biotin transport system substrate-specific component
MGSILFGTVGVIMYSQVCISRSDRFFSHIHSFCLVAGASILIGLFGSIAIPIPFSPIPMATQGSLVLLLSCLLGSKRAFAAVLGFLAQAAIGLPVCAGVRGGLVHLMGPTGGYLVGYLAAALLVGYFFERMQNKSPLRLFGLLCAGNALFFVFGVPYLSLFIGLQKAFLLGFFPFLIGDILKAIACVKILQWVR